jgi:hypothetical protein
VTIAHRRDRGTAALCLLATALLLGACTPGEVPSPPPPSRGTGEASQARAGVPGAVGSDEKALLDQVFTGREELGSGYGQLQPEFGNTLAGTPERVLSVTFAFICTGGAKVALTLAVDGTNVPSAAGMHTCDKSVFQASVEVLRADPVGFRATLIGSIEGSFAYAYYTEKQQLS